MVILTDEEARDLVATIVEVIAAIEDGTALRLSWTTEATDWCYILVDRLAEGD